MEKDLTRWVGAGKFSNEDLQWWQSYLNELKAEHRPVPITPVNLPCYREAPQATVLDGNLSAAIERHMERLDRQSDIQVVRRASRR